MRVRQEYPTPIDGVSTKADLTRGPSAAEEQINMRSNPVAKLTRRPSLVREGVFPVDDSSTARIHTYKRRGSTYRIVHSHGKVLGFKDGVEKGVAGYDQFGGYLLGGDLKFGTINDTTFIANTKITVEKATRPSINWPKVSYVNVLDALNYGETIDVKLSTVNFAEWTISYSISEKAADYEASDLLRGTASVAAELAALINLARDGDPLAVPPIGAIANFPFVASSKGSTLEVHTVINGGSVLTNQEVTITVASGQGTDSLRVFNSIVDGPEGLPLYARTGSVVRIDANPRSDDGVYYLEATLDAREDHPFDFPTGGVGGVDDPLREVRWVETSSREEDYKFDASTMPITLVYRQDTDDFVLQEADWDYRAAGDDNSVPFPAFTGSTIVGISYFQKRLVFLSENEVFMTQTDNLFNWFKVAATELLVTDPVATASSASGTDYLSHVIGHNRDLLVTTSNAQFKIGGRQAVTPQTVSMALTTSYNCQVSVPPVAVGSTVFLPFLYGDSTGILAYEATGQDDKDIANSVTNHVIGYMPGNITHMRSSSNLNMVIVAVDGTTNNTLFVYERELDAQGKLVQSAWHKWEFPEDTNILDFAFENDEVTLVCDEAGGLSIKSVNMFSEREANPDAVFLDDLIYVDHNGSSITLPDDYPTLGPITVVEDSDGDFPLMEVNHIRVGRDLIFDDTYTVGKMYVGRRFRSSYTPTRPFVRNKQGKTQDYFRLRVNRWIPTVVESGPVSFKIISTIGADYEDQVSSGRIMGSGSNLVGEEKPYTGDLKFAFSQNANTALAEFYTEHHLGMTITALRWEGQYHSKGRNI